MLKHLVRSAATGAVALSVLAVAAPAHADTTVFRDRANDTGSSADITRVKVANGSGGGARIAVRASTGELGLDDLFTIWYDTNRGDAGPEYKFVVLPDSDTIELRRLESFGDAGTVVPCDGIRASADTDGPDEIHVSIPRRCMGNPGTIRVSLRGRYVVDGDRVRDWAPSERRFFGSVPL